MNHLRKIFIPALLCSQLALALPNDKDQPIQLAADSVDMDEGKGLSVYQGDVDLRQGTMRLQADYVRVKHRGKQPDKIYAEGSPVRFSQKTADGEVKARSLKAEYVVNSELLTLINEAEVNQNGDIVRSDRITYDRVQNKVKAGVAAEGKQRVHITIQPPKK
jgi:lipopolysaccharide export system protein LptA